FFQAEDGIRDGHVTGVQTCALPILTNCETGCSQPTIAAAADTTATAASVPALSRARRRANLCRKVMAFARSWGEELVHVRWPRASPSGSRACRRRPRGPDLCCAAV